jgi:hypothetical protein
VWSAPVAARAQKGEVQQPRDHGGVEHADLGPDRSAVSSPRGAASRRPGLPINSLHGENQCQRADQRRTSRQLVPAGSRTSQALTAIATKP